MFLVLADTYDQPYGMEMTLFGIFKTREEATSFILDKPVKTWVEGVYEDGSPAYAEFNFLEGYEPKRPIYAPVQRTPDGQLPRRRTDQQIVGYKDIPKEEYVQRFITEFDGKPIAIAGYAE